MLNRVILMGRLTRDPELRYTAKNTPVCEIRIAVERDFAGKDGTREADFVNVICWRSRAEFTAKYFSKGQMIAVDGKLRTGSYTDKEGRKVPFVEIYAEEVNFAGGKQKDIREEDPEDPRDGAGLGAAMDTAGSFRELEDDGDLPF